MARLLDAVTMLDRMLRPECWAPRRDDRWHRAALIAAGLVLGIAAAMSAVLHHVWQDDRREVELRALRGDCRDSADAPPAWNLGGPR